MADLRREEAALDGGAPAGLDPGDAVRQLEASGQLLPGSPLAQHWLLELQLGLDLWSEV